MTEIGDLWLFIKNTKVTQLASLKLLQRFILSLNRAELTHLITSYLESKLSQCTSFNPNGFTLKQTEKKLKNDNRKMVAIDQQIVLKLNAKYGNKYRKKVISKTQQNNIECNKSKKHLLSIHPQVLSYSFQFLSFHELCKIQRVCVYFLYLNKKYPALTHYYFKMDRKFCRKAMRYQVPLHNLTYFKHIEVNHAYCNYINTDCERQTILFQYLLKRIVKQSKANVDVLTIDIPRFRINYWTVRFKTPLNILLYIMKQFDSLSISTLIWKNDCFKPSEPSDIFLQIAATFQNSFPRLKTFSIGKTCFLGSWFTNSVYNRTVSPSIHISSDLLRQLFIIPMIKCSGAQLESLDIDVDLKLFSKTDPENVIELIAKHATNLKTLSISYKLDSNGNNNIGEIKNIKHCVNVTHLRVRLAKERFAIEDAMHSNNIISYLFSIFVGITEFEFVSSYGVPNILNIDWKETLDVLIEQKRMYCMQFGYDILSPLKVLRFTCASEIECKFAMGHLFNLKYFDLEHLEISSNLSSHWVNDYLVPLLQLYDNNGKLSSIKLTNIRGYYDIENSYLEPILNILSNIPRSVTTMELEVPNYWISRYREMSIVKQKDIKNVESIKVVNKLCELAVNRNRGSKLQSIALSNMRVTPSARDYLVFMFGFENNISVLNNMYYFLQFT